jgi:hypothetical protein
MLLVSLYLAALFVALTPGVLLTLPKGGNRLTVAVVHGLVFAAIWYFTRNAVLEATEGFQARTARQATQMTTQIDRLSGAAVGRPGR